MPILSADVLGASFEEFLAAGGTDAAAADTAAGLTAASGVGAGIANAGLSGMDLAADAGMGGSNAVGGIGAGAGSNAAAAAEQAQATSIPNSGQAMTRSFMPSSGQPMAQSMGISNLSGMDVAADAGMNGANSINGFQSAVDQAASDQAAANQSAFRTSEINAQNSDFMQTPLGRGIQTGMDAFDKAAAYAEKNPIRSTMAAAYLYGKYQQGHQPAQPGLAPQQPGILADYKFNPNSFNAGRPNPSTSVAQQTMFPIRAAIGGIMQAAPSPMNNTNYPMSHNGYTPYNTGISQVPTPSDVTGMNGVQQFKSGDSVSDKAELLNYYESLLSSEAPASSAQTFANPSLSFSDQGTQGMSPQQAAMYRQNQINKRALMQGPQLNIPTSGIGQVNLTPLIRQKQAEQTAIAAAQGGDESNVESNAHGGIMQAHLGHYAHGGNPRLLKGPGDGMSDNIPATIDGRQPARLATGEFVVPADVVSHMGNGDTDSGAKKLHDWMAKVREARTGNPKQGKEINADKYLPK